MGGEKEREGGEIVELIEDNQRPFSSIWRHWQGERGFLNKDVVCGKKYGKFSCKQNI